MTEQDWHIPYTKDDMSLRSALESISEIRTYHHTPPLMLTLAEQSQQQENPVFDERLDLQQHDCIHVMLGRGLLHADEVFSIGFTVASSIKVSTSEQHFYAKFGKRIFTLIGELTEYETIIFRDAVRLAYISACLALDKFDFQPWLDESISKVRDVLGLEAELILAYYAVEQSRYPNNIASQRLLVQPEQRIAF